MKKAILTSIFICTTLCLQAQHALQLETRPLTISGKNGDTDSFSLSFGPEAGLLVGMVQEWVFIDWLGVNSYDAVMSRLDWHQEPLYYVGANASIMPLPRLFFGLGAWGAVPGLIGYIEDRDWNDSNGAYTNYSHHDNLLHSALFFDANAGYSLLYYSLFKLNLLAGFNFKQFHMSTQNGWTEYPPGSPPVAFYGEGIDYEVNFFIPYVGTEASWSPVDFFTLDAFAVFSPWLSFVYDRDIHFITGYYFQDLPQFGFYFSGVVSLALHLGAGWDVSIKNTFMWSPPFKGSTYDHGARITNERGGSSLILYSLSVSVNWGFNFTAPPGT
jgi:outer membrane protease